MKRVVPASFLSLAASLMLLVNAQAQSGRIYTAPDPQATGGIEAIAPTPVSIVVALDRERVHAYRAETGPRPSAFRLDHLPTAKYDLVCFGTDGSLWEGLSLGEPPDQLSPVSRKNLETRIAVADSFFNRHVIHRIGITGDTALALVERFRDQLTLKQSGEKLPADIRRIEVIELNQAGDDWQMVSTRHLYRETEPIGSRPNFLKHHFSPALGNIRVTDSIKSLGTIPSTSTP